MSQLRTTHSISQLHSTPSRPVLHHLPPSQQHTYFLPSTISSKKLLQPNSVQHPRSHSTTALFYVTPQSHHASHNHLRYSLQSEPKHTNQQLSVLSQQQPSTAVFSQRIRAITTTTTVSPCIPQQNNNTSFYPVVQQLKSLGSQQLQQSYQKLQHSQRSSINFECSPAISIKPFQIELPNNKQPLNLIPAHQLPTTSTIHNKCSAAETEASEQSFYPTSIEVSFQEAQSNSSFQDNAKNDQYACKINSNNSLSSVQNISICKLNSTRQSLSNNSSCYTYTSQNKQDAQHTYQPFHPHSLSNNASFSSNAKQQTNSQSHSQSHLFSNNNKNIPHSRATVSPFVVGSHTTIMPINPLEEKTNIVRTSQSLLFENCESTQVELMNVDCSQKMSHNFVDESLILQKCNQFNKNRMRTSHFQRDKENFRKSMEGNVFSQQQFSANKIVDHSDFNSQQNQQFNNPKITPISHPSPISMILGKQRRETRQEAEAKELLPQLNVSSQAINDDNSEELLQLSVTNVLTVGSQFGGGILDHLKLGSLESEVSQQVGLIGGQQAVCEVLPQRRVVSHPQIIEEFADGLYLQLNIERSLMQLRMGLNARISQLTEILPKKNEIISAFRLRINSLLGLKFSDDDMRMIIFGGAQPTSSSQSIVSTGDVLEVLTGVQRIQLNEIQRINEDTIKIVRNVFKETLRAEKAMLDFRNRFSRLEKERMFNLLADMKVEQGVVDRISCAELQRFLINNGYQVKDYEMMLLVYRYSKPNSIIIQFKEFVR